MQPAGAEDGSRQHPASTGEDQATAITHAVAETTIENNEYRESHNHSGKRSDSPAVPAAVQQPGAQQITGHIGRDCYRGQ